MRKKYHELKKSLLEETRFSSSLNDISNNKNFKEMLTFGDSLIPILMDEIAGKDCSWFHLMLIAILTDDGPCPMECPIGHHGKFKELRQDWIDWWEINQETYTAPEPDENFDIVEFFEKITVEEMSKEAYMTMPEDLKFAKAIKKLIKKLTGNKIKV